MWVDENGFYQCLHGEVITKLLSMPGFISNSPPRDMVFATWRKVFIRDTRKVKARKTGAVNVLGAKNQRLCPPKSG